MTSSNAPPIQSQSSSKSPATDIASTVLHNLTYHHLWTNLTLEPINLPNNRTCTLCTGIPPEQLHPDDGVVVADGSESAKSKPSTEITESASSTESAAPTTENIESTESTEITKSPNSIALVQREWVIPVETHKKWSIKEWAEIFQGIDERLKSSPTLAGTFSGQVNRLVMACLTNDGTIVYYFVNRGVTKPKKN